MDDKYKLATMTWGGKEYLTIVPSEVAYPSDEHVVVMQGVEFVCYPECAFIDLNNKQADDVRDMMQFICDKLNEREADAI